MINYFIYRLISTNGLNSMYIGLLDYRKNDGIVSKYDFYAQDHTIHTLKNSVNLNVSSRYQYNLQLGLSKQITQNVNLLQVTFNYDTEYLYNLIYFKFHEKASFKYPFGFKSGSNLVGYKFAASFLLPDYEPTMVPASLVFFCYPKFSDMYSGSIFTTVTSPNVAATDKVQFSDYKFTHLYDFIYILSIQAANKYPIHKFEINGKPYSLSSLAILLPANEGVYEFVVNLFEPLLSVSVNDFPMGSLYKNSFYSLSHPLFQVPPFIQDNFNFYDIQNPIILYKTVNVTNQIAGNILYFNYLNIDINMPMGVILHDGGPFSMIFNGNEVINEEMNKKMWPAKWNSSLSLFQVEFYIPKNSARGKLPFALCFNKNQWVSSNAMGENAQFYVISNNADLFGPIFSSIEKIPNNNNVVTILEQPTTFGWKLTISDVSGFRNGSISIRGMTDGSFYNFPLLAGGTNNQVVQHIVDVTLIGSKCISQDYIISDVVLYDQENNNSTFSIENFEIGLNQSLYNPFLNYFHDSNINRISVICSGSPDTTPPVISSFVAIQVDIDVGKPNREFSLSFVANDPETGLKENHYPIVYLTSINFETVECITTYSVVDSFSNKYTCNVELPLAFGYPYGILYSVYGLVNNGGYYGGASSDDLKALGFTNKVTTIYSIDHPVIIGSERISTQGGKLWIYGKGFKNVNYASHFLKDKSIVLTILDRVGYSALLLDGVPPGFDTFSIFLETSDSLGSNDFLITPLARVGITIPIPSYTPTLQPGTTTSSSSTTGNPSIPQTPTPLKCLRSPECGGTSNGFCSIGKCVCYSPWVGDDCLSKVIAIPQPPKNYSNPSTTITNPSNDIIFKTVISLISIRELDINNNQVFIKMFDNWTHTEINNVTSKYTTEITPTTEITTKLEWFKVKTELVFANQTLTMNPSTLKYTVELPKYKFQNNLNHLELVMFVSFESSKTNDICSSNEFTETTDNYLKLSVEDHSLYARFLKRGIVDGKVLTINNRVLDKELKENDDTKYSTSTFIGISIPNYQTSVIIDPDFSILLLHDSTSSSSPNSICTPSKSLSIGAIVGITVCAFAFASVVAISIAYHIYKSKKTAKQLASLNNKLRNIK